ncbi:SDR family NAD(P)-dependent oxidoreductase [Streptomyces tanashiensis]|uniref:SDR family NAD(P)-dependent oxidoreductase n=1 Tax=Streptomyces tanashiensis TaxID=67367 RepID=UPI0036E56008
MELLTECHRCDWPAAEPNGLRGLPSRPATRSSPPAAGLATGRRSEEVEKHLGGPQDNLLVTKLDVTSLEDVEAAAQVAVDHFGRIDVLVNNGGNFFAGYFEGSRPPKCASRSKRTSSAR